MSYQHYVDTSRGPAKEGFDKKTRESKIKREEELLSRKQVRDINISGSKSARARTRGAKLRTTCSYEEAGAAADEICAGAFEGKCTADDHRLWAWYCRHFDYRQIVEMAWQKASEWRAGELDDPKTAFQRWLSDTFPKGGAK